MKQIILSGNHVEKTHHQGKVENQVLRDVNVDIYEGDFTIIMGASGAGKSTLLYALSGMDQISGGQVFYKDIEISRCKEDEMAALRANEFGFVFQQTHLVSNLTLFENVAVAGYASGKMQVAQVKARADELLELMNVNGAKNRYPSQVSGGEAQRAAIARAMINQPGILFADEPTGALNKANSEDVLDLLTQINSQGQSILMVTHDLRAAIRGNRILYLEDGKILDEMCLPTFEASNGKGREQEVQAWLSGLSW